MLESQTDSLRQIWIKTGWEVCSILPVAMLQSQQTFGQIWVKTGWEVLAYTTSRYAARITDSLPSNQDHRLARKYWHTTSKYARITTTSVKSGSRLDEQVWGYTTRRYAARITAPLGQIWIADWLRGMGILPAGMLESQQVSVKSGSRLAAWEVVADTTSKVCYNHKTVSVKSGSKPAGKYWHILPAWYAARITTPSIKSGSQTGWEVLAYYQQVC